MKNYIFLLLWIIYFSYYFYNKDSSIFLYFEETVYEWKIILSFISAIIWTMTCLGLIWLINKHLETILIKLTKKSESLLDDVVWNFIIKFISIVKYLASFYLFFYIAQVSDKIKVIAEQLSWVGLLIILLVLLTSFVNVLFEKELVMKSKLKAVSKTLLPLINKVIVVFIWIIWVIAILWNLGYDVSALVAWAWIWGLAVALAAQKTIANVFGAVTILLNKPFKIWDTVVIDGHTWVVKEIWLSYITLFEKMWHQIMIPNDTIINTSIENLSIRKNRRTDFTIWVVYWTTEEKMKEWVKIIEDILEKYLEENTVGWYRVNFDMFWDFSLNINITYFSLVNSSYKEYVKQKGEINIKIKNEFEKANIDMAFPTQELIIKKES